jgi:kinesin family protein 3/17
MAGLQTSEETKGIIPRAFQHIFGCIDEAGDGTKYLVRCSYLEIYNEMILDLLGSDHEKKLEVREDKKKGIYVEDLTQVITKSIPEIERAMDAGNSNRKVGETAMNKTSSRSHSIFTIYLERSDETDDGSGKAKIRAGKLHLVDLAGSER